MGMKSDSEMVIFAATNNEVSLRAKPTHMKSRGDC